MRQNTAGSIGVVRCPHVTAPLTDSASIDGLPEPVQRSLHRSGVLQRPLPTTVVVEQRGAIRTSADSKWLQFTANERYTPSPPSFVWDAKLKMGGIGVGRARDAFEDGHGSMRVRLLGMFTVVDEAGPEMDQGSLMRWLNETMWFPAVWATDRIAWTPIDAQRARGSVTVGDLIAAAEFHFDDVGRLIDFTAERHRDTDDGFVMTPWSTPISDHADFGGVELPASGEAVWHLDEGDFAYIRIEATDVQYR